MIYERMYDADNEDEPIECDCCGYAAPLGSFDGLMTSWGPQDRVLCEICSSTYLSLALTYPNQCSDVRLYKSIAIIGNMVLAAIAERN